MTARKADPRVERWAAFLYAGIVGGHISDGYDNGEADGCFQQAERIVRAIDRARREERKRAASIVRSIHSTYYAGDETLSSVLGDAERAILNSPAGARAGKERTK